MRLLTSETLFFLGIIFCVFKISIADLEAFAKEELVPLVLDKVPPNLLKVSYNGKEVECGKEVTPTEATDIPTIEWNFDSSSFYTLIMSDPDAPSRWDHSLGEFLHWAVVNAPGDDFGAGETLAAYMHPGPSLGTGFHRYNFVVFKQPGRLDFEEKPLLDIYSIDGKTNFNLRKFSEKYGLGQPIAGNMFLCQFDDSVPEYLKKIGYTP